ncbi:antitoxin [Streptomyces poonensis]|uniref:Antitoxin n=1 Tax=Streptomyces poonensis TaxID=68255 RepID=A0A918UV24_9ACTN|nr:antitoxin [Streptomyces poonensis]GGZ36368.1 hypothetical protein GCM10010365_66480 [Streptomyces poonensis]GLJ90049.1 hypothetical protein GCM10017589_26500 [Streptomyces poonensis]
MGLLDNVRARLGPAKGRISDLAKEHGDKVGRGLDKAAQMVDERTKGKYSDRIHTGTDKAKGAVDRLAHKDDGNAPPSDTSPPPPSAPPPPAS